jgi:hypothetical protein
MDQPLPQSPWPAPTWVSVTPTPSKRHRRKVGIIAALGLTSLAAAATVTVLAHDEPTDADADAYSLNVAAAQAQDATTMAFTYEMSLGGDASIDADVSMDLDRKLMSMSMEMDELDGPITCVFDMGSNDMYFDAGAFGDMLPVEDAQWIKFGLDDLTDVDLSELMGPVSDNPLDATMMFDVAKDVEDLGFDEVEGQRVKHYLVTVDTSDALDAQPEVRQALDGLAAEMAQLPETIVYDAYVTEANELVRLVYGFDVLGESMTMDITVTSAGEPVDIEVPDPSTVMDFDDFGF